MNKAAETTTHTFAFRSSPYLAHQHLIEVHRLAAVIAAIVIRFGLARWTARRIEKASELAGFSRGVREHEALDALRHAQVLVRELLDRLRRHAAVVAVRVLQISRVAADPLRRHDGVNEHVKVRGFC